MNAKKRAKILSKGLSKLGTSTSEPAPQPAISVTTDFPLPQSKRHKQAHHHDPLPKNEPDFFFDDMLQQLREDNSDAEPDEQAFDCIKTPQDSEDEADRQEEDGDGWDVDIDPASEMQRLHSTFRSDFLPILMAHEGIDNTEEFCQSNSCSLLPEPNHAVFRCDDCTRPVMLCKTCVVLQHAQTPFHRIRKWTASPVALFTKSSLKEAGLIFYLGHQGESCPYTNATSSRTITVMDTHSFHQLPISFCECPDSTSQSIQLLNIRIFPATELRPETGFTFRMLDHFEQFNYKAYTTPWQYHKALQFLTDPLNPGRFNVYQHFNKVARQWRVLNMYKRSGRMDGGKLKPGELVVQCPACPKPGINIPDDWKNDPLAPLLYARFHQGDGNFSLEQYANRPGPDRDPSFVDDGGFWADQSLCSTYAKQPDPGNDPNEQRPICATNTIAGDPSGRRKGRKLAVSGVVAGSCRHIVFQKNSLVNVKVGEKFCEVDLAFAAMIRQAIDDGIMRVVESYDIACKLSIHFEFRTTSGEVNLFTKEELEKLWIIWLVPKFHLGGHEPSCADNFSFNFTKWVGRMSGEGVETPWADLNKFKWSSSRSGFGARCDLLNGVLNHWNWNKLVRMPERLMRDYATATSQAETVADRLTAIEEKLGEKEVKRLESQSATMGGEQYRPNKDKISVPSRSTVLEQLRSEEDSRSLNAGINNIPEMSLPSAVLFINTALDLEAQQLRYFEMVQEYKGSQKPDVIQKLQASKKRLEDRINQHYAILDQLAPGMSQTGGGPQEPHKDPIVLPSNLSVNQRQLFRLDLMTQIEAKLRIGQAHDVLEKLRKSLGVRSFLTRHSDGHRSYSSNTRSKEALRRADANINQWTRAYRRIWKAIGSLNIPEVDLRGLEPLEQGDLIVLASWMEDEQYRTRGAKLPWIWKISPLNSDNVSNDEVTDAISGKIKDWNQEVIRLEWVHARAASERWNEEVLLLKEESRRCVVSFRKEMERWVQMRERYTNSDGYTAAQISGFRAYAARQAYNYGQLLEVAKRFYAKVKPDFESDITGIA